MLTILIKKNVRAFKFSLAWNKIMIIKILKSLFVYLINISFNNRLIESLLKKMLAALIFMIEYSSELSRVKRLYEIFENSNLRVEV